MQLRPILKVPNKLMQLTINSSLILDAEGRELDGNYDGQPGGNFVAILDKQGVISDAIPSVRTKAISGEAIDAMMAHGSFPTVNPRGHNRHSRVQLSFTS